MYSACEDGVIRIVIYPFQSLGRDIRSFCLTMDAFFAAHAFPTMATRGYVWRV